MVGAVGMAASDEAENDAVMPDREDGPVAEPVDQPAGGGRGGDAGGEHLVFGDAEGVEVSDEGGPAGGGVAGL